MKKIRIFILIFVVFAVVACQPKSHMHRKALVGTWKLERLKTKEQTVSGEAMGNPTYTFTSDGWRIKTVIRSDSVRYIVQRDSVFYPNSKLPASKIIIVEPKHIILQNTGAEWFLFKK